MITSPAPLRREWLFVFCMMLLGAALRFSALGRTGLTHFDEGVYALAGLWPVAPGGLGALDPMLIPYAPPGFPILVGIAYWFFGEADLCALIVAALCGVLTIPIVSWLARRTFGPGAGAAASALAASSLAHVAFSRKGLTDAPFLLNWLVALGLGGRFLERPGALRALVFGISVGVAQGFKYNGWIAGAVTALTAVLGLVSRAEVRRFERLAETFGWGLVAALSAGVVYWPWLRFVDEHGGYSALLRHQRGYLGGPSGWFSHWNQQLAQVVALSGGPLWGAAGWSLAWLGCVLTTGRRSGNESGRRRVALRIVLGLVGGGALFGALPTLPWWAGLCTLPWLVCSDRSAWRLLGVSWLVLSVLTPFYHPYARLWLPLHASCWILLGGVIGALAPSREPAGNPGRAQGNRSSWRPSSGVFLALIGVGMASAQLAAVRPSALPSRWVLEPAPSLRAFTFDRGSGLPALWGEPDRFGVRTLRVLARRPLALYLLQRGAPFQLEAGPVTLLAPARPGEFAAIDDAVLGHESARLHRELNQAWKPVWRFHEGLDPVTLLDVRPDVIYQARPTRENDIWVYSARPSS